MRTILLIMLHEANSARSDIPMEVNMNRTVLLVVTPCSLVYITTLNKETSVYEGWNFNSGNYLFTTDTK